MADAGEEIICRCLAEFRYMDLDMADPLGGFAAVAMGIKRGGLLARQNQNGVQGHQDVADIGGDLAHDRIIEEGFVERGYRQNRDVATVGGGLIDIHEAHPGGLSIPCANLGFGQYRSRSEIFCRKKLQIVCADAGKQYLGIDVRLLAFGGN